MTEIQVGKVMLTPKGEYDSTKTYIRLDAVTYQGSSYVCLSDTTSAPPGDSWQLLADKGADGQPGKDGQPGSPGVTPHIDATTGNWFIGTTNTGVKAQGPAGQNGSDGKPGSNGSDGVSPHIDSTTGHWFIGSTDTGVSARGPQGEQGSPGKDGVTPDVSNLATKTDLANYYTKAETDTKLSTKADQAEYQTLNDKFNNMQIGGRNLLTGTQDWQGNWNMIASWSVDAEKYKGFTVRKHSIAWYSLGQYYDADPNTTYTFSFYAKTSEAGNFLEIFTLDKEDWSSPVVSVPAYAKQAITADWQRYSITFTTKSGGKIMPSVCSNKDGITIYVAGYKLEEGTVSTDWTPAPEDTTAAIQKNTTAIDQANQQITDLQTAVKAQQSAAINTSSQSTNKNPSDYSDGIFYEVKTVSVLGIDRSGLDTSYQQGSVALVTVKKFGTYARQTAEVIDSTRPMTFERNGSGSSWYSWEAVTTW